MENFTVALESGTVGSITASSAEIGQCVTVSLDDENGNPIKATGLIAEILESREVGE